MIGRQQSVTIETESGGFGCIEVSVLVPSAAGAHCVFLFRTAGISIGTGSHRKVQPRHDVIFTGQVSVYFIVVIG